ncbi:hypothetical protein C9374_006666 [Naegleria lovaniensis]|uniref:Protein kinase domain-containing protein n=1 Tax=Naegleria lovaniensis TaxID=51637 RepID=A0AA88GL71_NAELO|nr:uncharacterized protein C9374_006666 [Naegleria lovaniensis]KAG2379549.1 hypothetical protein C9374_006666 [Naegleria lovaniensis]
MISHTSCLSQWRFVSLFFCLIVWSSITTSSSPLIAASRVVDTSLTQTITLFIQPLPSNSSSKSLSTSLAMTNNVNNNNQNNNNCTSISQPCRSISEAIQVLLNLTSFKSENISAQFVLLRTQNGSLNYGTDQCNVQQQQHEGVMSTNLTQIHELRITSYNASEVIVLNCATEPLFRSVSIRKLYFQMTQLNFIAFRLQLTRIDKLIFSNVNMSNIVLSDQSYDFNPTNSEVERELRIESCHVSSSKFVLKNGRFVSLEDSSVQDSELSAAIRANVSITTSILERFSFSSPTTSGVAQDNLFFVIRASQLRDSKISVFEFSSILLEDVTFGKKIDIELLFSSSSQLRRVKARDVQFYMILNAITYLSFENCEFVNLDTNTDENQFLINIMGSSLVSLHSNLFEFNRVPLFLFDNLITVNIIDTVFKNNRSPCVSAKMMKFFGNTNVLILGSIFKDNYFKGQLGATCNGGALYVESYAVDIKNSLFDNNTATNGGGLFFVVTEDLNMQNVKLVNNYAFSKGGAFFIYDYYMLNIDHVLCENNSASYAGGCLYSERSNDDYISNFTQNGNMAYAYGSNTAKMLDMFGYQVWIHYTPQNISKFTRQETPQLYVYPGQVIPQVQLVVWTNRENTEHVKFLEEHITCTLNSQYSKQALLNVDSDYFPDINTTLVLRSLSVFLKQPQFGTVQASISIHTDSVVEKKTYSYPIGIDIHVLPCPDGKELTLQESIEKIYVCTNIVYTSYDLLIAMTCLASILIFSVMLACLYLIFRLVRNIVRKLKRLERKENAEKSILLSNNDEEDESDEEIENAMTITSQTKSSNERMKENTPLLTSVNSYGTRSKTSNTSSKSKKKSQKKVYSWMISIDEIEIVKRIAEGANGTVYLANWNGTKVALKSLKYDEESELSAHEDDEFEREASLLGSIRHPNIVQFFGVIIAGSKKYMVVEYLEKGSLDKLIYNIKLGTERITLHQKIDILLGVAKGMNYLHSLKPRAIIHRDLKPGNILLDQYVAKICDFGLSKTVSDTNSATTNIGTLFYMANEMIEGKSSYNHKVDIYSFAIIMWELFFEENPYLNAHSEKLHKYRQRHVEEKESIEKTATSAVNILFRVMNGERPILPFNNDDEMKEWVTEFILPNYSNDVNNKETFSVQVLCDMTREYLNLMKQCWNGNDRERPDFNEICIKLSNLASMSFHEGVVDIERKNNNE